MKARAWLRVAVVLTAGLQTNFATDADPAKLAAANNNFALKLLKQLASEQPNASIFVSPYSVATALQMAANGAAGQTEAEMRAVLGTTHLTTEELNEAGKAAAGLLNPIGTNIILTTANALWYRTSAQIKADFLAANQKYFAATIRPLEFANVSAAEAEINRWASDQTQGRITGIADGILTPYTDLILANAIYFKGRWLDPFDKALTEERPFHPATDTPKNVPMMQMSRNFTYRKGSGYQAVRLPYMGGDLAMYVFLPDTNSSPAKLLEILNGDNWRRVTLPGFGGREGFLVLPRFKLENTFKLNQALEALGMKMAFQQTKADFSGMFSDPHFISEVRQKAFVEVNEEGTEAAAVTAIPVGNSAIELTPAKPFEMIVDRPFMFAIVDARSEVILFMGVVNGV